MAKILTTVIALLVLAALQCSAQTCVKVDTCKCEMSDNAGQINLMSLASTTGAAYFTAYSDDGWTYNYNPCIGFSTPQYSDLAIQQISFWNQYEEYNLGIQSSERFEHSISTGTSIKYDDNLYSPDRNSSVLLVCAPFADDHVFEFLGELIAGDYEFMLTGPCACPGGCDDNGLIVPTTTTPSVITTTTIKPPAGCVDCEPNQPINTSFDWNQVGADLVSLIFHDLILIVVIGSILAVTKFLLGYNCYCSPQEVPNKSISDV